MKLHLYYVCILTNSSNKVLYVGVTNDLERRCYEHEQKLFKGFTHKYNVDKLIYYEKFDSIELKRTLSTAQINEVRKMNMKEKSANP